MSIGPAEYVIIGFPGNKFTGDIAPELSRLVESDTIRILDLVFIMKGDDGAVVVIEVDEDEAFMAFADVDAEVGGFIGDEDIAHAAAAVDPGSSVLLLLWEDTWAVPLVDAIRASGGVVLEGSRVPHELVDAAEALIATGS